ncbi:hypothetical protein JCM6882_003465 [Rhodosporidiobolus microsporus]
MADTERWGYLREKEQEERIARVRPLAIENYLLERARYTFEELREVERRLDDLRPQEPLRGEQLVTADECNYERERLNAILRMYQDLIPPGRHNMFHSLSKPYTHRFRHDYPLDEPAPQQHGAGRSSRVLVDKDV